jgi:hypothetical protein
MDPAVMWQVPRQRVRLRPNALGYNFRNITRTLAVPREADLWSPTTPRETLVKIGAKFVHHGRHVTFQLAKVAVPRRLFRKIRA